MVRDREFARADREKVMFSAIGNICLTPLGWVATTGGRKYFFMFIYYYCIAR
jgi:hypothetical protein